MKMHDDYTYIYLFFKLSCLVTFVFPERPWMRATVTQSTEGRRLPRGYFTDSLNPLLSKLSLKETLDRFFCIFLEDFVLDPQLWVHFHKDRQTD